MRGGGKSPPLVSPKEWFLSWLGAFLGVGLVAYLSSRYCEPHGTVLLIGSFGASAVLVYGTVKSPLAQPRNLLGGHMVSALVGVTCQQFFGNLPWLACALAASFAILAMHITKTLHPPGGATALIAIVGGPKIHDLGYMYILIPSGAGALILLIVALFFNNLFQTRRYPEYWL